MVIDFLFALVATLHPCSDYTFTMPSDCTVKRYVEFVTSVMPPPESGYRCVERPYPTSPGLYDCEGWSHAGEEGAYMSCECYENETPPAGEVWYRRGI